MIAEAAETALARELAGPDQASRRVQESAECLAMSQTDWPTFERVPAVAFVDRRRCTLPGANNHVFLCSHPLSPGLDSAAHSSSGHFITVSSIVSAGWIMATADRHQRMTYISSIPVVELERIAYDNFVEFVRPRLYEGVVEHLYSLRRRGTAIVLVSSSPGLVIEPLSIYLELHRTR